jgi:hypothetical protein
MEHALKCDFGAIVRIRKVLGCWEHDGSMEESVCAPETSQAHEGLVNPSLLLWGNGKLRFAQSKHAMVIAERYTDPKNEFNPRRVSALLRHSWLFRIVATP